MQAVRPASTRHSPPRKLIDDNDLAIINDVRNITFIKCVGPQACRQMMHQANIGRIVKTFRFPNQPFFDQQGFDRFVTFFRQKRLLRLLIDRKVTGAVFLLLHREPWNKLVDLNIKIDRFIRGTRNNQRCAGLVNQNRVHFVNDGETQASLYLVRNMLSEIIAKIIKAEFIVSAVGDVRGVSCPFLFRHLTALDHANRHPEKFENRRHPARVPLSQVLVDGNNVHTIAGQCVEVSRQGRNQCFALTGAHFRNISLVQNDATNKLHIEVTQPQTSF